MPKVLKQRAKRKHPEQDFQQAVAKLLNTILSVPVEWTAIGHGGGGAVRGAILKSMGLKPGWPDIIISFPYENGRVRSAMMVGLELKSLDGTVSFSQKALHASLERSGWMIFVCRTLDEVIAALNVAGVPHRPVHMWPTRAYKSERANV